MTTIVETIDLNSKYVMKSYFEIGAKKYGIFQAGKYCKKQIGNISRFEYNVLKNCVYEGVINGDWLFKHNNDYFFVVLPLDYARSPDITGNALLSDEEIFEEGITLISEADFGEKYLLCEDCDEYHHIDCISYIESYDRHVCEECLCDYIQCDNCGDLVHEDDEISDGNISICECCYDDEYQRCYECGCLIHESNINIYQEEYYCDDCLPASDASEWINSYGYSPKLRFYEKEGYSDREIQNKRYYGLEIEVQNYSGNHDVDCLEEMDGIDWIYLTEDGSLNSSGVEITTHPGTMEYFRENLPELLSVVRNGEYGGNFRECGLHIHVNKASIADFNETIPKLILLVDIIHEDVIKKIDRRYDRHYCQKNGLIDFHMKDKTDKSAFDSKKKGIKGLFQRGSAVNLQPDYTVEFRFFNSTTNIKSLFASMQFIDVLIDLAEKLSFEEISSIPVDFIGYWIDQLDGNIELKEYYAGRVSYDMGMIEAYQLSMIDVYELIEIGQFERYNHYLGIPGVMPDMNWHDGYYFKDCDLFNFFNKFVYGNGEYNETTVYVNSAEKCGDFLRELQIYSQEKNIYTRWSAGEMPLGYDPFTDSGYLVYETKIYLRMRNCRVVLSCNPNSGIGNSNLIY